MHTSEFFHRALIIKSNGPVWAMVAAVKTAAHQYEAMPSSFLHLAIVHVYFFEASDSCKGESRIYAFALSSLCC